MTTATSTNYLLDFDAGYVWRVPGPSSMTLFGMGSGVIVAFERCVLGEQAIWKVFGGRRPEFMNVRTSNVVSIEQVLPEDAAGLRPPSLGPTEN